MTRTLLALAALTALAACGDSEESYELEPSAGASVDASTGASTGASTDSATDPSAGTPMDLSTGTFADPTAPAAITPPGGTVPAPARPIGAIPDAGGPAVPPDGTDDAAALADPAAPTAPPTLSADNHVATVAALLDVYRGAAWRERLLGAAARAEPLGTGFADAAAGVTPDAPVLDVACANGGTARFELVEGAERGWDATFGDCQDGPDVLDGRIRRTASGVSTIALDAVRFGVEGADGTVSFDGRARWMPGAESPGGRTERAWSARGASFADTAPDAGPALRDADYRYASVENASGNVVRAELDGGFTMSSPVADGAEIVVETPEALRFRVRTNAPAARGDAWTFEAGSLRAVAADGSALLLQSANGDRDTVDVTITGGDGTVTLVEPWSTWRENLRLTP